MDFLFGWEDDIIDNKKPFKRVGTHNGKFHADEVLATAILKEIYDIEVVRSRDPEVLSSLELVYDVGGGEFDHHDNDKIYRESGTPYAACGLIWRKFGRDVIRARDSSLTESDIDWVFKQIDAVLMEGVDANDNGVKTSETIIPTMCISTIISGFNPPWYSDKDEDEAFHEAVSLASMVLDNTINQQFSIIKARSKVIEAYKNRTKPQLLVLDQYCPWGRILQEIDTEKEVLFVVYPNKEGYALQTVRKEGGSFESRKNLPKEWAGKRDEELGKIIGINDAVFCHPARFIAGAKSFESIMKMADIAIDRRPEIIIPKILKAPKDLKSSKTLKAFKKLFGKVKNKSRYKVRIRI
ncbi:MYG1 family protein [Clostridium thermosuccinogenes]|uniref:MYG1 family protein n=1 Tax=Clostridium thermosuccinogenes TaxID=84032 RepID=UPI001FA913A6|nr:MYG1 family protein [Pseudoclostridium thermosuccinogenes]